MANEIARALRKRMTRQEVGLWRELRAYRGARGWHFRRQAPFRRYVLDFVCFDARLVVELDGSQHGEPHHAVRDAARDALLSAQGFEILRFWNWEWDEARDLVLTQIDNALREREHFRDALPE